VSGSPLRDASPVKGLVISVPHEAQVFEPVVGLVSVDVVDDGPPGDWSVGVLPDAPMLELVAVLAALNPPEHPVSGLLVTPGILPTSALEVGSAGFVAVDAFVADVPRLAFCTTRSAHEAQRLTSSSHP
jgi:hypothetical protein